MSSTWHLHCHKALLTSSGLYNIWLLWSFSYELQNVNNHEIICRTNMMLIIIFGGFTLGQKLTMLMLMLFRTMEIWLCWCWWWWCWCCSGQCPLRWCGIKSQQNTHPIDRLGHLSLYQGLRKFWNKSRFFRSFCINKGICVQVFVSFPLKR